MDAPPTADPPADRASSPDVDPGPRQVARLDSARRLFGDHDFRNYWFSSATFGLGIWAYITTMGWTALELTGSAFQVSVTNAVYFLPMFLFALPAGVAADAFDRRNVILVSRGASGVAVVVMAVMAATGTLTYPWLLVFSFLVGLSIIGELAARQAFVAHLVEPSDLVNATALTAVQGGVSRVLGPMAAGWLIDTVGDTGGYGLFAGTSLAFVWFFSRIRTPGTVERPAERRPLAEIRDGFRYLFGHRDALGIVGISILAGAVGWIHLALMPVVAKEVLEGGSVTLGLLGTAVGLGSVPGSIALSLTRDFRAEGRVYVGAMLLWGTAIVGFGYSRWLGVSVVALGLAGVGFGTQVILVRTILLRIVERNYHGRVLGTLMLTWGANVIGTLTGGSLADIVGVSHVVGFSGATIIAVTLGIVAWNPRLLRL